MRTRCLGSWLSSENEWNFAFMVVNIRGVRGGDKILGFGIELVKEG